MKLTSDMEFSLGNVADRMLKAVNCRVYVLVSSIVSARGGGSE